MIKILLTGSSGFVGNALLNTLVKSSEYDIKSVYRILPSILNKNIDYIQIDSIDSKTNWKKYLEGIDMVVHLAGRVHLMNDSAKSPLDEFRHVNTEGTLNLAKKAAIAGVKRFIFISTIKVLGEQTAPGQAFKSGDSFNPQDPYSISKVEAEVGLKLIGEAHGMEIVIIRPPLVFGQGVKGNFTSLLKLTRLPIPLPFGSIQNKRSLVSVENLIDLIVVCLTHPKAKNQTFLVSDDDDMNTSELISRLAEAGGYKAYIFGFPLTMLYVSLRLLGKLPIYERLCGSMQVNIEDTKSQLSWSPPFKVNDSLSNCWLSDAHR